MGLISLIHKKQDEGIFREIPLKSHGRLFTSPMPTGAYDVENRLLKIYTQHHIGHVFPLVTDSELEKHARGKLLQEYSKRGMTFSRYVIADYTSPSMETLQSLVEEAVLCLNEGERIAVHCHAGVGRTSLAVACIVMAVNRVSSEEALEHIKNHMMVNITDEQIRRIRGFAHVGTPAVEAPGGQN